MDNLTGTPAPGPASAPRVAVSPRYLAGPGDSSGLTGPLSAAGWPTSYRPPADLYLTSPCERGHLRYQARDVRESGGTWRAGGHPAPAALRTWLLTATWHTPAEILAGLTSAWAADPGRASSPAYTDEGTYQFLQPLVAARWGPELFSGLQRQRLLSPDGRCAIELDLRAQVDPDPFWGPPYLTVTAAVQRDQPAAWTMRASRSTPAHLLAAFTTALTVPAPVHRDPTTIAPHLLPHLTLS